MHHCSTETPCAVLSFSPLDVGSFSFFHRMNISDFNVKDLQPLV